MVPESCAPVHRRARLVLPVGGGIGTDEIQRRVGVRKPTIRRRRTRDIEAGVGGSCRDQTRPPGTAPLGAEVFNQVLEKTLAQAPPDATHKASQGQGVAGPASALPHAFHANPGVPARPGRTLLRPDHPKAQSSRRAPLRRRPRRGQSTIISNTTTPIPRPLSGPHPPAPSSKRSTVGNKRWNRNTRRRQYSDRILDECFPPGYEIDPKRW